MSEWLRLPSVQFALVLKLALRGDMWKCPAGTESSSRTSRRTRVIHKPQFVDQLSLLRKMALNILRQDKSKGSMRAKRKRVEWNVDFLDGILRFTRA
jgi:hypothetical protein